MSNGENLVKGLYKNLGVASPGEITHTKVSTSMKIESAAFFLALGEYFGTSRVAILDPMFTQLAKEMFESLKHDDRVQVASMADAETTLILSKLGIETETTGPLGTLKEDQHWRSYDLMLDEIGSKK